MFRLRVSRIRMKGIYVYLNHRQIFHLTLDPSTRDIFPPSNFQFNDCRKWWNGPNLGFGFGQNFFFKIPLPYKKWTCGMSPVDLNVYRFSEKFWYKIWKIQSNR